MRDTEFTGIWRGTLGDRRGPREQTEDGKVGKCRDERWRPEGGGEVQVDRYSTPGRFGGRSGCNS